MLWQEIFLCIQHLKIGYSDALLMPTSERRFYLGLLVKNKHEENEQIEKMKKEKSTGKGSKQVKISGEALKTKIKSGEIPLK